MLALLAWIPEMATWLPEVVFETDMFARIPNYVLTTAAIVAVIVLVGFMTISARRWQTACRAGCRRSGQSVDDTERR